MSTEIEPALASMLAENGYAMVRRLPSGEVAGLRQFMFTVGLCVGLDEFGLRTRFCYPSIAEAAFAMLLWNGHGDPPGAWIKQKGGVERCNPARNSFRGIPIVVSKGS